MNPADFIPATWLDDLPMSGSIGLGHDIATTTKGTANWSSLSICQHASPLYTYPLVIRWRTADPEKNLAILDHVVSQIERTGRRARRLSVDASNEKYHAQRVRSFFAGRLPVELVVAGEKTDWRGESYDYKTLLGSLYSAAFEDNLIAMPEGKWLLDDHRLVKRERGTFVAEIGKDGGHGDTFDSGKLAYWATQRPAVAAAGSVSAADVGSGAVSPGSKGGDHGGWRNPLARLFDRGPSRMA